MKYLLICFSLLFIATVNNSVHAQSDSDNLYVTATAKVELPADLIQFNILINTQGDSLQAVYEEHQQMEQALVSLLEQYDISEENIQFEPLSVSEYQDRDMSEGGIVKTFYRTRQQVHVTFNDFEIYEEIQIALIKNGFDEFSGDFLATGNEEGMKEALRKTIQKAKETAQLMAAEAGVSLGPVVSMRYSEERVVPRAGYTIAAARSEAGGLLQYNQTVTVYATVSMKFALRY